MAGCTASKLQRSACFKVHSVNLNSSIALVIFFPCKHNIDIVVHAVNSTRYCLAKHTARVTYLFFLTFAGLIDLPP